jgi:hypothetical protein
VEADALGQMVACPRCQVPFIAAEEVIPTVQPKARSQATSAASPATHTRRRRRPSREKPVDVQPLPEEPKIPDPEHDPHLPPVAGLPVSVLVGLALLPFGIPLLWWAAPIITGKDATLSLAVPVSLAIAASALCLGVVYTIDWTASTRIKGVLMLVGLAYLSAAGLFFLKKDMMDRMRGFFGPETTWTRVHYPEGRFRVQLPGTVEEANDQPLPKVQMIGKKATFLTDSDDKYQYLVMASIPEKPAPNPNAAWYDAIGDHLAKSGKIVEHRDVNLFRGGHPGHQWTLQVEEGIRIVQVYVIDRRVYYLSVEGHNVTPTDEEIAVPFFKSFEILSSKR